MTTGTSGARNAMLFSSPIFVFLFLPLVLALHAAIHPRLRNTILLLTSLAFYAMGEPVMSVVLLVSIVANYVLGVWMSSARRRGGGKGVLIAAIAFNLGLLLLFKYADWLWDAAGSALLATGLVDSMPAMLGTHVPEGSAWRLALLNEGGTIRLPLGISFFAFQGMSYVIDIYRRDVDSEKNPVDFAMYKAFFPQLIAGPIVRYRDVHEQIHQRVVTRAGFAHGLRRFVLGLGKKMLIANVCAEACDKIFALPAADLPTPLAWLGIVCYTLQIYFDFSGYSDMAIGLGHMFGFKFLENFDYPYVSKSITEFWRRWHISLSSWFRDYLYIPLGGNRKGRARTYLNLILVFFLCGLWHGANVTFVVWGFWHGAFLVAERVGLSAWLEKRPAFLQHAVTLLAVMIGWVFFRAADMHQATDYLAAMFGMQTGATTVDVGGRMLSIADIHSLGVYADTLTWTAILAGIVGSTPWLPRVVAWHERLRASGRRLWAGTFELVGLALLVLLFLAVATDMAAGAYNPFIYFRF